MKALVAILMGSDSDAPQLKPCADVLRELGIPFVARVLSAHRTPKETVEFVEKTAPEMGVKIFICAAGGAAHLAGVVAAHTTSPVIGIPIESPFCNGLDSLLSTVQMPGGIPVATVATGSGGAKNAGFLAGRILGLADEKFEKAIQKYKDNNRKSVLSKEVNL